MFKPGPLDEFGGIAARPGGEPDEEVLMESESFCFAEQLTPGGQAD